MGLIQTRKLFFEIRQNCRILVSNHAFKDYPQRGFSKNELVRLVRSGIGRFADNKSSLAISDSYLFYPKDAEGRECKLVLLINVVEINKGKNSQKETVIVCSAYREM